MRTIIAGSRGCVEAFHLRAAIEACGWVPTVVLSGGARGADALGEQWARSNGVPIEIHLADWKPNGVFLKSAGILRNQKMVGLADALIALWDGKSPGTRHVIDYAGKRGLRVYTHRTDRPVPSQDLLPDCPK